ncbi:MULTISPECIES: hypothetical protein [Thermomonospora]|uniref:Uncharacterized protein n=1 Tax=Thermomonospora curvata (strain ATCC 19995 / DSM 43183 / JCM 3096 / KCTC 9072 / NBRC 15933 / NCIMB 10081 / Henssen B9) TaxID=471852 RepID=D1A9K1_THECD|nr:MULTISPECIES: hypothetical protein [Thermomonospora]ACY98687.1 hypothetical protein Tcur_3146 [Thermomonospora curvata DSM 43183]
MHRPRTRAYDGARAETRTQREEEGTASGKWGGWAETPRDER